MNITVQLFLWKSSKLWEIRVIKGCFFHTKTYVPHVLNFRSITNDYWYVPGADPGFQVRGGALKKIAPSRGRLENFWGISCEKSRFYAKKSYFFNCRGRRENVWGISCEKSRFYAKKNHIFSNFRGARPPPPPPLNTPLCSTRRKHFPVLSSFMTYSWVSILEYNRGRVPLVEQERSPFRSSTRF